MKIGVVIVVVGIIVLLLISGCGSQPSSEDSKTTTSDKTTTKSTDTTSDESTSTTCADEPSKCADQSGLQALSQQANPTSVCDTPKHSGWKQICLAIVNKDIKRCDRFTDPDDEHMVPQHMQALCRIYVIAAMKKASLCESENVATPGDDKATGTKDCYAAVAMISRDKSLCAKTDDKAICEYDYSIGTGKIALADCKKDDRLCITEYAWRHNYKAACDKLDGFFKVGCLASISGDAQSCRQFSGDVDEWYYCDNLAHYKLLMPAPSVFDFSYCKTIHTCYRRVMPEFAAMIAEK
jgi:uncharacterized protein YceK